MKVKQRYHSLIWQKMQILLFIVSKAINPLNNNINRDLAANFAPALWKLLPRHFKIHWLKFEENIPTVLYKKRYSRRFSLNVFLSSPFQLYKTHFIFQSFAFNNRNISKLSIYRVIFPTQEACNAVQYFKILKKCNLWDILLFSLHSTFMCESKNHI